jgi:hypothetical protein
VKGAKVIIFSLATLNFLVDIYQEMGLKAPNLKRRDIVSRLGGGYLL